MPSTGTFSTSTQAQQPGFGGVMPPPQTNNPLVNQYGLYNQAVQQQAGDYGNLMSNYQNLQNQAASASKPNIQAPNINASSYNASGYNPATASNPNSYNPGQYSPERLANPQQYTPQSYNPQQYNPAQYNPDQYRYQESSDVNSSLSKLKELSTTGGYSDEDIANLRARGLSPIRSIYSSANRDVDRQRSLQGGFSPNYDAVKSKMARELSDSLANQITNVNAGIAQNVASNKLQAAPQYAGYAAQQSGLQNQIGMNNSNAVNQANQFNSNAANEAGQFNAGAANQASQFNTGALNAAQLQNILNQINTDQFNTGAANQASQFNIGNQNQAQLANIANQMQTSQFNAGQANQAGQNNAQFQNQAQQFNSAAQNAAIMQNAQNVLQSQLANQQGQNQNFDNQLAALNGQQGLYGTTPAMSALFGNQALSAADLQRMINQQGNNGAVSVVNSTLGRL